ncbi:MAG: hypothetical protein ACYTHM_02415 [Planctomycetota bacterium]|jgi:hypothetical protein
MFEKIAEAFRKDYGKPDLPLQVSLNVGGIPVTARMADAAWADSLTERYEGFLTEESPEWSCQAVYSPAVEAEMFRTIQTACVEGRHYIARHDFWAEHEPQSTEVRAFMYREASFLTMDAVVRMTFAFAGIRAGGFLTHAAGLVRSGRGFLLPGITGRGKTSLCGLLPTEEVLSDELILLRPGADGFVMWGTPFWGEGGQRQNRSVPLSAVLFPRKGEETRLSPLPPLQALPVLMETVLSFGDDDQEAASVLDVCTRVVSDKPAFLLEHGEEPEGILPLLEGLHLS